MLIVKVLFFISIVALSSLFLIAEAVTQIITNH